MQSLAIPMRRRVSLPRGRIIFVISLRGSAAIDASRTSDDFVACINHDSVVTTRNSQQYVKTIEIVRAYLSDHLKRFKIFAI